MTALKHIMAAIEKNKNPQSSKDHETRIKMIFNGATNAHSFDKMDLDKSLTLWSTLTWRMYGQVCPDPALLLGDRP